MPDRDLTSDEQREVLVTILNAHKDRWFFAAQLVMPFGTALFKARRAAGIDPLYDGFWSWCSNKIAQLLRYEDRVRRQKVHHWTGEHSTKLYRYTARHDPNDIEWWLEPEHR